MYYGKIPVVRNFMEKSFFAIPDVLSLWGEIPCSIILAPFHTFCSFHRRGPRCLTVWGLVCQKEHPKSQHSKNIRQSCKVYDKVASEVPECHVCYIIFIKQVTKASLGSMGRKIRLQFWMWGAACLSRQGRIDGDHLWRLSTIHVLPFPTILLLTCLCFVIKMFLINYIQLGLDFFKSNLIISAF